MAGKFGSFSLLQLIALLTAVASAFALCIVLFNPPLGSSGLGEARLPALVLVIALWFCRSHSAARFGTYAIVASLLALQFFGSYLSQTDWLMGHTHGPPQLIVATCWASTLGLMTGVMWILSKLTARQNAPATGSDLSTPKLPAAGWLGAVVIVPLTLLSGLLALVSFGSLSHAQKRMDNYIKQRQIRAEWSATSRARMSDSAGESPEEQKEKFVLYSGLNSKDEVIRHQAALGILGYKKITDSETRLKAIEILYISPERRAGEVDRLVEEGQVAVSEQAVALGRAIGSAPDDTCRKEVIQSLGQIGPPAAVAASRLGRLLETPEATNVRSDAAKALAAIGPSAKDAVPYFRRGWQDRLLAVEDAQLLYKIDPTAAENFQIPRDAAAAAKLQKLARDDAPRFHREATTKAPKSADRGLQTGDADDPERLADLAHSLNDDDTVVRREAATALYEAFRFPMRFKSLPPSVVDDLIGAIKRPEPKVSMAALTVLRWMGPAAAEAVPALLEVIKNPTSPSSLQAIYALSTIGPAAVDAVPRLSQILTTNLESIEPQERSAAAQALGAIGPAAKSAVPSFREAWEKHLITSEDAQALKHIDPKAAEELQIP